MPSRTYSETRGPVEHTAIGADEVDAIADGNERPTPDSGAKGSSTGPSRDSSRGSSRNASGPAAARDKDRQDESGPRQGE